jgi:hypothetical protein
MRVKFQRNTIGPKSNCTSEGNNFSRKAAIERKILGYEEKAKQFVFDFIVKILLFSCHLFRMKRKNSLRMR